PGSHCATVVYTPIGQPEGSASNTYQWCFKLH
ncbi:MAG: hypothetical protein QOI56_1937, partial [Actinomycetota bacterium]|nr:hypothetical protein [Actinomycetota bacterium]